MRLIDGEKFAAVLQELADKHAEGGKTDVAEILLSVKGMLERQETIDPAKFSPDFIDFHG